MPAIFSDSMMLQRDKPTAFWGTAAPGATIDVACDGSKAQATADGNGKWTAQLPAHAAGGPFVATVHSGSDTLTFKDVYFGEVWLAGGQSNMEMNVTQDKSYSPAANPADPLLHYITVPRTPNAKYPDENGILAPNEGKWFAYAPANALNISAVGYAFAHELRQKLGVPVAIINCNYGSTAAESWVSRGVLATEPEWAAAVAAYDKTIAGKTPEEMEGEYKAYLAASLEAKRQQNLQRQGKGSGVPVAVPKPPEGPYSKFVPASLYQGMIRTVEPYTLRGFIFYQGESNAAATHFHYADLMTKLIGLWRHDWGDDSLPFYFVQIASWGKAGAEAIWPVIRDAQATVAATVPHTGMAVSLDLGVVPTPHYPDKKTVGDRLARIALDQTYGIPTPYLGPKLSAVHSDGDKISVTFDRVGAGLKTKDGAATVDGFEIKTSDGKVVPVSGAIQAPGTVVLTLPAGAPAIQEMRYGWENYNVPQVNLYNSDGLPAEPFHVGPQGQPIPPPIQG